MKPIHAIAVGLCAVALSGCAVLRNPVTGTTAPSPTLLAAWQAHAEDVSQIESFTVLGRAASSAIGFKADLRWKQKVDGSFEMRVAGPFGARAAELSGDLDQVQVRIGDEPKESTADPEAWLRKALGVPLPVAGLRWWALGLPAPNSHYDMLLNQDGRALRIIQNGWELDFPDYRDAGPYTLPRRIDARNGDTRVIVLADRWAGLRQGGASDTLH